MFDGVASHVAQRDLWRRVLEAAFQADRPRDVVDLGCGTGACAVIAAELGHRVRAFDASPEMIAAARRAAEAAGVEIGFEVAQLRDIAAEEAVADIVTLRNVLWTLERPMEALRLAHRLLRPGGLVVVSDGLWSVAPRYRSTYPADVADRLPLHDGLTEEMARRMLADAGFTAFRSWQHLFAASPYPGEVPVFVLGATRA
nr:class I SAM-dependent methyltransferase [Ancylobacter oerskovii]